MGLFKISNRCRIDVSSSRSASLTQPDAIVGAPEISWSESANETSFRHRTHTNQAPPCCEETWSPLAVQTNDNSDVSNRTNMYSECTPQRLSLLSQLKDVAWHLNTRKHLYKQSLNVMTRHIPEYELILRNPTPTDPRCTETELDVRHCDGKKYAEYREAPFARKCRWPGGLATFLFVAVAEAFTLDTFSDTAINVWATHGSLVFYTMTAIIWFVFWTPLLTCWHLLGQCYQEGPLKVFCRISPRAIGVGFATAIFLFLRFPGDLKNVAEALIYLHFSLRNPLPWGLTQNIVDRCSITQTVKGCDTNPQCVWNTHASQCFPSATHMAEQFYKEKVLGLGSHTQSPLNIRLVYAAIIAVVILLVVVKLGLQFIGQLATFTVLGAIVFLMQFAWICSRMHGSAEGMARLFSSAQWALLQDRVAWYLAMRTVLRSTTGCFGFQCFLASFNRIGGNIIKVTVFMVIFNIFAAGLSMCILHSLLGVFASSLHHMMDVVPSTGIIHAHSRRYMWRTSVLHSSTTLLRNEHKQLTTPGDDDFPYSYLNDVFSTNKGDNMFFRLYTLGLSSVKSASVFSILFFFTFSVLEIVSVAVKIMCLWGLIQDISAATRVRRWKLQCFLAFVLFMVAVLIGIRFSPSIHGIVFHPMYRNMQSLGIPCLCLMQVLAILFGWMWESTSSSFGTRVSIFLFLAYLLGVAGIGISLGLDLNLRLRVLGIAWGIAMLVLMPPIIIFVTGSLSEGQTFKELLPVVYYRDIDTLRRRFNRIVAGQNKYTRLHIFWTVAMKYLIPTMLVFFMTIRTARLHIARARLVVVVEGRDVFVSAKSQNVADLVSSGVIIGLSLLGCCCPKAFRWLQLSQISSWGLGSLPRKYSAGRLVMRRKPLGLLEEFLPPKVIWINAYVLEQS